MSNRKLEPEDQIKREYDLAMTPAVFMCDFWISKLSSDVNLGGLKKLAGETRPIPWSWQWIRSGSRTYQRR